MVSIPPKPPSRPLHTIWVRGGGLSKFTFLTEVPPSPNLLHLRGDFGGANNEGYSNFQRLCNGKGRTFKGYDRFKSIISWTRGEAFSSRRLFYGDMIAFSWNFFYYAAYQVWRSYSCQDTIRLRLNVKNYVFFQKSEKSPKNWKFKKPKNIVIDQTNRKLHTKFGNRRPYSCRDTMYLI